MIIYAPFTQEQVINLSKYQHDINNHPFTCICGDVLEVSEHGWFCKKCEVYVQDWAHDFMANPTDKQIDKDVPDKL